MPKRGFQWTPHYDELLKQIVQSGKNTWPKRADELKQQILEKYPHPPVKIFPTGKQCYEHWLNKLDPNVSHKKFTPEEFTLIKQMKAKGLGFAQIARRLKHSRDQVRNYYDFKQKQEKKVSLSEQVLFFRSNVLDISNVSWDIENGLSPQNVVELAADSCLLQEEVINKIITASPCHSLDTLGIELSESNKGMNDQDEYLLGASNFVNFDAPSTVEIELTKLGFFGRQRFDEESPIHYGDDDFVFGI